MKRIFTIIMIGILLVGCAKTDSLTEHDWVHYGSTCIETIYFGKDGHFAYYSDEGNPVNDSDLSCSLWETFSSAFLSLFFSEAAHPDNIKEVTKTAIINLFLFIFSTFPCF